VTTHFLYPQIMVSVWIYNFFVKDKILETPSDYSESDLVVKLVGFLVSCYASLTTNVVILYAKPQPVFSKISLLESA